MCGQVYSPAIFLLIYLHSEILHRDLHVDLNVLCDLIERLSGLFITAIRSGPRESVLHDIILPRSWLINFILPASNLKKDSTTIFEFVGDVIDLMQRIDVQVQQYFESSYDFDNGDQFTAEGSRVTGLTGPLYIARM